MTDRHTVATSDVDYTDEEREYLKAVQAYQKKTGKRFPTFSEYLAIAVSIGYRKVAEPGPLPKH